MAKRLINAIGKGLGKTTADAAKGTARRATRDVPSAKSFYNLGMGIGPFIRNTVQSYGQDTGGSTGDAKSAKASLGFAKENVVNQKNMASQLSALTSIMSDIRKISLAQLNLQRATLNKKFGDRSDYLSTESALEQKGSRASISGTQDPNKKEGLIGSALGFLGNNPLIAGSLMGLLALANAKDIKRFMDDSGLTKALKEGTKAAVSGIATLISDTIKNAILTGLPNLYNSMKKDLQMAWEDLKAGNAAGVTTNVTKAAKPVGALAGMYAGLRYTPGGLLGKVVGGTLGGIAGYTGVELGGEELADLQRKAAAGDKEAIDTLQKLGVGAGVAASAYGISKVIKNTKAAAVTPTAAPGVTGTPSSAPPSPKVMEGKPLTQFGSVGENREMAKNKTLLEKSKASFSKTLQLLRKLVAKIGMQRVAAYIAARFAAAAAIGAAGFAAGPVGFITTALTVGLTIYELYSLLSDLDKELEENPAADASPSSSTTTPAQTPAGSLPATGAGAGRGNQGGATADQSNGNQAAGSDFTNPLPSATRSKGRFGEQRSDHLHSGVDLSAELGAPILTAGEGEVIATGDQGKGGLGKFVTIRHPNGMTSTYGHMSSIDVKQGDKLKKGQNIGKVGSTGASEGPHLHIEMKNQAGDFVNPRDYIQGLPAYSGTDNGANPEGSLKTIPGKGAVNVSGTQNAAPGSGDLGSTFASAFGFDPSRMGVDLSKTMTGDQIAKLNALQKEMGGGSAMIADAIGKVNQAQQSRAPTQPSAPPAPIQKTAETQSKEKDFLWMHYNNTPQSYYAA